MINRPGKIGTFRVAADSVSSRFGWLVRRPRSAMTSRALRGSMRELALRVWWAEPTLFQCEPATCWSGSPKLYRRYHFPSQSDRHFLEIGAALIFRYLLCDPLPSKHPENSCDSAISRDSHILSQLLQAILGGSVGNSYGVKCRQKCRRVVGNPSRCDLSVHPRGNQLPPKPLESG